MSEVVITLKAGKDFSDPWIVLHGASVEEAGIMLLEAQTALLGQVRLAAQMFQNADTQAAIALVQDKLGGQVIEQTGPQATAGAAPWDAPAAPATAPWDVPQPSAGPAPFGAAMPDIFGPAKTLFKIPYVKDDVKDPKTEEGKRQKKYKDYFYQQGNKLIWNKDRKGFEFENTPTPELLAVAKQGAAALGGSVEG